MGLAAESKGSGNFICRRSREAVPEAAWQGDAVKFRPGQIVATPGALDALSVSGENVLDYLERHLAGDWGELDEHD